MMYTELVEKLIVEIANQTHDGLISGDGYVMQQALSAIETLQARIAELEAQPAVAKQQEIERLKSVADAATIMRKHESRRADILEAERAELVRLMVSRGDHISNLQAQLSAIQKAVEKAKRTRLVYTSRSGKEYRVRMHSDDWQAVVDAAQPQSAAPTDGWMPIETAPDGMLVVTCWVDREDKENPSRYAFDYLEDGVWQNYFSEHEHYLIAGVAHGNSEDAPYTNWQPLPPAPLVKE